MNPKVSVIIPTYNRPKLIRRAIHSILAQTYQNFEIVVVDDSSNNKTEKVIEEFNDKRIRYVRNKQRTNLPRARNQGVRESSPSSKYIAFLDGDDEYLPLFLEKTVGKLEEKKDIALVGTYAESRNQNGEFITKMNGETKKFWKACVGNGNVIRKSIFTDENLWYDERKVMEGLDFGIKVLKNHKWECLPEILRIYYPYPLPNKRSASSSLQVEEIERFYKKYYSLYSKLGRIALGYFYLKIGREFLKTGEVKKGRSNLLKAFLIYPHPRHLLYYLISLVFPKSFQSVRFRILKYKIFKGRI